MLICGLAIWRGDQATRWIGATFLVSWLGSLLVHRGDAFSAEYGILAIDIATLAIFVWISIRSRRLWTIAASAFITIIVASHIATMIDLRVTLNTLRVSMAVWSYAILACIAFGTWTAARQRRHAPS